MSLVSVSVPYIYFNVAHDALRMVCIQVVVQFLFSIVNSQENPFFSVLFLQTISFVVMGVLFYWLVLSYIIQIKTDTPTPENTDQAYSPATHTPPNDTKKPVSIIEEEQDIQMDASDSSEIVDEPSDD
jgi:cytoskeletal protein RodZ